MNGRGHELTSSSLSGQTADDADDAVGHKSFISATVQTGFCEWSAKYFAQPVMKVTRGCLCVLSSRVLQLLTRRCPERSPVPFPALFPSVWEGKPVELFPSCCSGELHNRCACAVRRRKIRGSRRVGDSGVSLGKEPRATALHPMGRDEKRCENEERSGVDLDPPVLHVCRLHCRVVSL